MDEPEKREEIAAIRRLQRGIDARTRNGTFQDDSDVFDLDRRLMEAELRWPGSTLPLYYARFRPAWLVGAGLLAAGSLAVLLIGNPTLGWVAIGLGVLLMIGPAAGWYMSRPRLAGPRDRR
jgi:hypothetical protein